MNKKKEKKVNDVLNKLKSLVEQNVGKTPNFSQKDKDKITKDLIKKLTKN